MPAKPQASTEWVDGFLFVGNQLALDFLNTRPVLSEGPKELLADADALVRWLVASGALTSHKGKGLARRWGSSPQAARFLRELLAFRERLRTAVIRLEAGLPVSDAFVAEINSLLEQHPFVQALRRDGRKFSRETAFEPQGPEEVWAPIAMAAAELLSDVPANRVRKCESCVVHYQDTSKKGSRRWCSMNICGNKVKVAAYQKRNRAAEENAR
jgi:predicted RNA-binding Zn ribbon-like protein